MPYCRSCGVEVSNDTTYCPECGEELNFEPPEPEQETDTETEVSIPSPDLDPAKRLLAKIGAVISVPLALAGIILEIASVYTLNSGGYTLSNFIFVSFLFIPLAVLPIAYLVYFYTRIKG